MYMEKAVSVDNYSIDVGDWDYWELMGYYTGADWPTMRMIAPLDPAGSNEEVGLLNDGKQRPAWVPRNSMGRPVEFGFGSAHNVINAVMGDCSVQAMDPSIDLELLRQLGTRADGVYADIQGW
jgi:hypothetical protein